MRKRILTAAMLRETHACASQVTLFKRHFPKGVVPTPALCRKHAKEFDYGWAAVHLLTPAAFHQIYKKARDAAHKEYIKARDAADKVYENAKAAARTASGRSPTGDFTVYEKYDRAAGAAYRAYTKALLAANRAYEKATAPATKAYTEAIAAAFCEAWHSPLNARDWAWCYRPVTSNQQELMR